MQVTYGSNLEQVWDNADDQLRERLVQFMALAESRLTVDFGPQELHFVRAYHPKDEPIEYAVLSAVLISGELNSSMTYMLTMPEIRVLSDAAHQRTLDYILKRWYEIVEEQGQVTKEQLEPARAKMMEKNRAWW